jgi:hypothetical protein
LTLGGVFFFKYILSPFSQSAVALFGGSKSMVLDLQIALRQAEEDRTVKAEVAAKR